MKHHATARRPIPGARSLLTVVVLAATSTAALAVAGAPEAAQAAGGLPHLKGISCTTHSNGWLQCAGTFNTSGYLASADLLGARTVGITAVGAPGGRSDSGTPGGLGGAVQTTWDVPTDDPSILTFAVGGAGGDATMGSAGAGGSGGGGAGGLGTAGSGGGGGGATTVTTTTGWSTSGPSTLLAAGPGGGGGSDGSPGGDAGRPGQGTINASGTWYSGTGTDYCAGNAGSPSTAGSGTGTAICSSSVAGQAGAPGHGGDATSLRPDGKATALLGGFMRGAGGGGGGVYGGGGGSIPNSKETVALEAVGFPVPAGGGGGGGGTSAAIATGDAPHVEVTFWTQDLQTQTAVALSTAAVTNPNLVTATATVTIATPQTWASPTGTVQFAVNGKAYGSPVQATVNRSTYATASIDMAQLPQGRDTVTASYQPSGNPVLQASSGAAPLTVFDPAPLSITSSTNTAGLEHPATLTVTLPADATGTVRFLDAGQLIGASEAANGSATFTPPLTVGSHFLTAEYKGDSKYGYSWSSNGATVTVAPPTTVALDVPPLRSVTLSVVTVSVPGQATGTVQLFDRTLLVATAPIVNGRSSLLLPAGTLKPGIHLLKATYSGDTHYSAGTSGTVTAGVS